MKFGTSITCASLYFWTHSMTPLMNIPWRMRKTSKLPSARCQDHSIGCTPNMVRLRSQSSSYFPWNKHKPQILVRLMILMISYLITDSSKKQLTEFLLREIHRGTSWLKILTITEDNRVPQRIHSIGRFPIVGSSMAGCTRLRATLLINSSSKELEIRIFSWDHIHFMIWMFRDFRVLESLQFWTLWTSLILTREVWIKTSCSSSTETKVLIKLLTIQSRMKMLMYTLRHSS